MTTTLPTHPYIVIQTTDKARDLLAFGTKEAADEARGYLDRAHEKQKYIVGLRCADGTTVQIIDADNCDNVCALVVNDDGTIGTTSS